MVMVGIEGAEKFEIIKQLLGGAVEVNVKSNWLR